MKNRSFRRAVSLLLAVTALTAALNGCAASPSSTSGTGSSTGSSSSSSSQADTSQKEAPMLAEKVSSGELPALEDRLPENPKELNELKTTRRAEISEKIRVARGFGDLSENSEYDEAKNEQAIVEARILTLENQLKNIKIIEKSDTVKGTVSLGSFVTIRDVEFGDEMTYRIISSVESSNDMSTITDESPVGKALLGHKAGETVEVTIPSGAQIEYQIIKVE